MSALGPCRGVNVNKPVWLVQKERKDATSGSGVGLDHDAVGERTNGGGGGGSLGGGVVDDAYIDGRYADADGGSEERDQFGPLTGGRGGGGPDAADERGGGGWRRVDDCGGDDHHRG